MDGADAKLDGGGGGGWGSLGKGRRSDSRTGVFFAGV